MAKRSSIGSLMRKKLSDITNSQSQSQVQSKQVHTHEEEEKPLDSCNSTDKECIQQLLKERMTLMKLLAEKNKMLEWSGAEMQMLRGNVQKLQLQNWNLAQSNTHMLAELNLGRERIKALQHELLWRAALLKGKNTQGMVDMNYENKGTLPHPQIINDGDEKAGKSSPKSSSHKQSSKSRSRRCTRRRSISSPSASSSTKNSPKTKVQDKRGCLRRQSAKCERHEGEALENLFEIEDANYVVIQPARPNNKMQTCSRAVKHETENRSPLRKEVPRSNSFRILMRRSAANKDVGSSRTHSAKTRPS